MRIAVLGATGEVGRTMLEVLESRVFPVTKIYALASERSVGQTVNFKRRGLDVIDAATFDFEQVDIALFSAGGATSALYAPKAAAAGCLVIDNSSQFRYEPDVPLVIPEVNPDDVALARETNIIANPNCSTIQMLVALKPLYDAVGITRINVATYQSVSGSGHRGVEELRSQTSEMMNGRAPEKTLYPVQIAFNAIPQIDVFLENGYTKEEMKMHWETQKILHDANIMVNATTVRVPVFFGHSEAVHIETERKISLADAKALLREAPGVVLCDADDPSAYPTAVTHAATTDAVFVGRVREDHTHPCGLNLWIVADNVRKGAASNAVQIAELWAQLYR